METRNILRIAQLSDPQLGFTDSRNRDRLAEARGVDPHTLPLNYTHIDSNYLKNAVTQIQTCQPAPDLVVVNGDLVDVWSNQAQWDDYTQIVGTLTQPVYAVMGNHDGFNEEGLAHYRHIMGKQDFYHFTINGVFFLVLNSNYLKYPERMPDQATIHQRFAEQTMEQYRDMTHKFILMHHPLYFEHPDEAESYFTLSPKPRQWVLDLATRYHVKAILCGHYHRNCVNRYSGIELITTGPVSEAMGNDCDGQTALRGYRFLELDLTKGSLRHAYIPLRRETAQHT